MEMRENEKRKKGICETHRRRGGRVYIMYYYYIFWLRLEVISLLRS